MPYSILRVFLVLDNNDIDAMLQFVKSLVKSLQFVKETFHLS